MAIEEILKAIEEMDKDEFDKLIFSKKLSDNIFDASYEATDKLWKFEEKREDILYDLDAYFDGYFTEPYEALADERKAYIKKYILVLAYFKVVSKITDKFEELIDSI